MWFVSYVLALAGMAFALYQHRKTQELKKLTLEMESLLNQLAKCENPHSPEAKDVIRKIIAGLQKGRQILPDVDVEGVIVKLADLL